MNQKKGKSKAMRKIIALLLCAVMLLGISPQNNIKSKAADTVSNPRVTREKATWDCIYFGSYYQSNDSTKEKIKWRVLSVDGDNALIFADKGLDCKTYNEYYRGVTWETCTLRTWLNSDFYNSAFNSSEQSAIKTSTVVNDDNPYYDTEGGNNTSDKIFLLSIDEVRNSKYGFNSEYGTESETRQCKRTNYAIQNGCGTSYTDSYAGNCWWWLRSPGIDSDSATIVGIGGWGDTYGGLIVDDFDCAVRPALNINLSSSTWTYAGTVSANIGEGSDGENNAEDSGDKVSEETSSPTAADSKTTKQEDATSENKTTATKLKTQKITTTKIKAYKAKKLKKKSISFKLKAKTSGDGKLIYSTKKTAKKLRKYIKVSKSGKVTLKKKAKKGTYKILITASKTSKYKKATKVVNIKVK